jgi:phosphatidylglycerol:prolipoprotein diacylglycerol transferase
MYPIICKLGPLTIHSYGLMLVLAFSIATLLLIRQARNQGLNPELIFNLCFIILFGGIIGARILYIMLNLEFYLNKPVEIIMLTHGGLAWFGGLILGSLSGLVYLRHKGLEIYKTFDLIIPYVALAHAIGRVGCFLNGCCFGKETLHFGLYFPVHDAILIPTQLYSSLALLGIYIVLRIKQARVHQKGEVFYLYFFLYSLWRFFIEFSRGDSEIFILGLSVFQIISIALFILSVVMLIRIKRHSVVSS